MTLTGFVRALYKYPQMFLSILGVVFIYFKIDTFNIFEGIYFKAILLPLISLRGCQRATGLLRKVSWVAWTLAIWRGKWHQQCVSTEDIVVGVEQNRKQIFSMTDYLLVCGLVSATDCFRSPQNAFEHCIYTGLNAQKLWVEGWMGWISNGSLKALLR